MSKFGKVVSFVLGAAIGSVVTFLYTRNMYEALIQEEIDSVKQVFSNRNKKAENETADNSVEEQEMTDYIEKVRETQYGVYSNEENEVKKDMGDRPYVISPDEFGEFDDYEKISLTYYADGVLADENDEIVDDAFDIIGEDSLNSFGEYEDDSVFVRNDERKCDYEILKDQRNYSEIVRKKPHQVEG